MPDDLRADAGYEQDFYLWSQDQAARLRSFARGEVLAAAAVLAMEGLPEMIDRVLDDEFIPHPAEPG